MTRKHFFILIFIVCLSPLSYGQKIDSLLAVLDSAKGDRKVKTLNELFRENLEADPVKALGYTREALSLATEIGDKKGLAASYNNLGISYKNQGALDKALEYYINSLKIYEELDNKEGIATTKNNIANIYSIKKDFGQAMKYMEESNTQFVQLGDQTKIIGSLNNLGNLHSEIQLYEQAMKYFSQAYQLSEKAGIKFADPMNNVGNIFFKQENYPKAVEYYMKALTIEQEKNNKLGILNIVTNLGVTFTKAKQPQQAQQYLDEAISLSKELQAFSGLPSVYKARAENYYNQGKTKEAYETQLQFDDAREKVYGVESSKNILQMEMLLNFEEKEREFEALKKEDEIKTLELRNSRLFIILVILAILATLGGYNFFYMTKAKRIKKKNPSA